jgi:hypothetical protein
MLPDSPAKCFSAKDSLETPGDPRGNSFVIGGVVEVQDLQAARSW